LRRVFFNVQPVTRVKERPGFPMSRAGLSNVQQICSLT
jgi:hypothetical protein